MLRPLPLLALLAMAFALAAGAEIGHGAHGKARLVGSHTIRAPALSFGGLSAIELDGNGTRFTVLSDRGFIATGRIRRDGEGRIVALDGVQSWPLKAISGRSLRLWERDAEGLAIGPSGPIHVSFEGFHRVRAYPAPTAAARSIPGSPFFAKLDDNLGLEALAIDRQGRLLAIPEAFPDPHALPLLRLENGMWRKIATIPRRGPFRPTGADIGPDGALYLLERDFVWYRGFRSRIRRFRLAETGISEEETLLVTPFGRHDNLEGIAVWPRADGQVRMTLISDDNANWVQRSEMVEYDVSPLPPRRAGAARAALDMQMPLQPSGGAAK